jgi:hypothetical protein
MHSPTTRLARPDRGIDSRAICGKIRWINRPFTVLTFVAVITVAESNSAALHPAHSVPATVQRNRVETRVRALLAAAATVAIGARAYSCCAGAMVPTVHWQREQALVRVDLAVCACVTIETKASARVALAVLAALDDLREKTQVCGATRIRGFKTLG